jgi:predicted house-cleaning noncanonical NTP pyrophosphatase (MazG superfamily)
MRKRHDKLVRDHIPAIIEADGKRCEVEVMNTEAYVRALRNKLREEVDEAAAASGAELVHELGDVLEVIAALADATGASMEDVFAAQRAKRRARGGFEERLRLVWVDEAL